MKIMMVACVAAAMLAQGADARQNVIQPQNYQQVQDYQQRTQTRSLVTAANKVPYDQFILGFTNTLNNNSPKEYLEEYVEQNARKLGRDVISQALDEIARLNSQKSDLTKKALGYNIDFLKAHSSSLTNSQRSNLANVESMLESDSSAIGEGEGEEEGEEENEDEQGDDQGDDIPDANAKRPVIVAPKHKKLSKKHKSYRQPTYVQDGDGDAKERGAKKRLHYANVKEGKKRRKSNKLDKEISRLGKQLDGAGATEDKTEDMEKKATKKHDSMSVLNDDEGAEEKLSRNALKHALNTHKHASKAKDSVTADDIGTGEVASKKKNGKKLVEAADAMESAIKVKDVASESEDASNEKKASAEKKMKTAISKSKEVTKEEQDATTAEKKGDKGTAVLKKKTAKAKKEAQKELEDGAAKDLQESAEEDVTASKEKEASKILETTAEKSDDAAAGDKAEKEAGDIKKADATENEKQTAEEASSTKKKAQASKSV